MERSRERVREGADAQPARPMIARRRAVGLLSAGRAAESRDLLQATIASGRPDAKDPVLLYLLAESQRVVKDLDAAQATAQALIAANPEDVRGLHVLSLILQDKGDIKGAERALRDLIARDPMDANALNSLGYMLAERSDCLDEAVPSSSGRSRLSRAIRPTSTASGGRTFSRAGSISPTRR